MPTYRTERRLLQAAVALGGLMPVFAGGSGALFGALPFDGPANVSFDSHFRYLSALLLGIGLAFWASIPTIERQTARVRLLTAIVFLGGLARLGAALTVGLPATPMILAIVMELAVTPALCLWQGRIARRFALEQL